MKKLLLSALAMVATVAAPGVSLAQTFAYVNTSGEVQTMDSDTAMDALSTAPNISMHSGVMLITTTDATTPAVGQSVAGV